MRRLILFLMCFVLLAACNVGQPNLPATPTIAPIGIPDSVVDPSVPPSEAVTPDQSTPVAENPGEPIPSETPGGEAPIFTAPGDPGAPVPPVAAAPQATRSADAQVNPSGLLAPRAPQAQVNPSGPPPAVASSTSAETRAVAQPFLQSVLRRDLEAARQYYAPSARPHSWDNVLPGEMMTGATSDFSECVGVEPVTTDVAESATVHSVTFRFPTECAKVPMPAGNPDQQVQRFNGLGVRLERIDNQWWVTGIGAFRATG